MKTYLILITAAMVVLSGCRGPQGDPGPQGPQGAQGASGTANVHGYKFTIRPQDWAFIGTQGKPGYGVQYTTQLETITQSVNDVGMVLVYWSLDGNTYYAMPYTIPAYDTSGNFINEIDFSTSPGYITFDMFDSDGNTIRPTVEYYFKVVVMDGNYGKRAMAPPVDLNDYNAVKAYYHLAD